MADYRELLRRAVDALPENNGAARRQVYEKARNALVGQLRAIQPPLPAREITQHRLQLEDCIREVEQAATEDLLTGAREEEEAKALVKNNPEPVAKPEPTPEPVAAPTPTPTPTPAPKPEPEPTPAPEPEVKVEPAPVPVDVAPKAEAEPKTVDTPKVAPEPEVQAEVAPKATEVENSTSKVETKPKDNKKSKEEAQSKSLPDPETPASGDVKVEADEPQGVSAEVEVPAPDTSGPEDTELPPLIVTETGAPERPAPQLVVKTEEPEPHSLSNSKASEAAIQQLIQEAASDSASVKPMTPPAPVAPISFDIPKRPTAPVADLRIDVLGTESNVQSAVAPPQAVAMSAEREVELDPAAPDIKTDSDAQGAVDRAIEALDREARGENSGLVEVDSAVEEPEPQTPTEIKRAKLAAPKFEREDVSSAEGGGGVTIFLVVLALLLVGAGGAGFWAWREGYVDLYAMFGQTTNVAQSEDVAPAGDAGPGNTAPAPDAVAPVARELDKSDERLPGSDATDSAAADATPANAGEKTDERLGADTSFAQNDAGTPAAENGEAAGANASVAGTSGGAQSLLLEASTEGTTGAVPFSGNVDWTRGVDELGQPTLIAKASIPARNLGVEMLIRRNADPTLPASHLIEVDFSVSDSFIGGAVASVPGILLKNEELVRGVPLVGASARVVGNSFLFALSAAPQDLSNNTQLLASRKWMDLALIYATSTRAIITLEKDAAAQSLFDEVMAIWAEADKDALAAAPAAN